MGIFTSVFKHENWLLCRSQLVSNAIKKLLIEIKCSIECRTGICMIESILLSEGYR